MLGYRLVSWDILPWGRITHKEAYIPPTQMRRLSVEVDEEALSALVNATSFLPLIAGDVPPSIFSGVLPLACR